MMFVVLGGLLILDVFIVPGKVWLEGLVGFVSFGYIPKGVDLLLLGALVGYSAYGGFGNNAITNWYRDKGYGMGGKIGYIPAAIGGKVVHVSAVGKVPMPTEKNLSSWKGWWKLLNIDQCGVFYFGAMIGMFLPGILYVGVLPRGGDLPSWGIAASSASGLILKLGNFGWFLALFFGFWILYSTALSNVDLVTRQCTDMLWFASEGVRKLGEEGYPENILSLADRLCPLGFPLYEYSASPDHLRCQRQYCQLYNGPLSGSDDTSESGRSSRRSIDHPCGGSCFLSAALSSLGSSLQSLL